MKQHRMLGLFSRARSVNVNSPKPDAALIKKYRIRVAVFLAENHHGISPAIVDAQLRQAGFKILEAENRFIERPGEQWWLLIAQR
jgi:hypothetical protein